MKNSPILYLHEYEYLPEDVLYWKNDEYLSCRGPASNLEAGFSESASAQSTLHLCVGIGTYKTSRDGELYLCALINTKSRRIEGYSLGVYRSAELVGRALEIFFEEYGDLHQTVILRSSQNPVYKKKIMEHVLEKQPTVIWETTQKGTRGGVMAVSTFFSQLMRKIGGQVFTTWQDLIDWLEEYIIIYNKSYKRNGRTRL